MTRSSITLLFSAFLFAACTGGSGDGSNDASVVVTDADPNAPDGSGSAGDDAGTNTGVTDAAVGGGSDAGATAGIDCGEEVCNEATEECCVTGFGGGGSATCVATGTCEGTPSTCDGPEDCGGDICCGTFGGASCTETCEGQAAELCHTESDCTTVGDMCCDFGPLSICAANCGGGGGGGGGTP